MILDKYLTISLSLELFFQGIYYDLYYFCPIGLSVGGDKNSKYQNRVILTLYVVVESHKTVKNCIAVEIELGLFMLCNNSK